MVSFFAGTCELCGETNAMATPEECKSAGFKADALVCVDCMRRVKAAAGEGGPYAY